MTSFKALALLFGFKENFASKGVSSSQLLFAYYYFPKRISCRFPLWGRDTDWFSLGACLMLRHVCLSVCLFAFAHTWVTAWTLRREKGIASCLRTIKFIYLNYFNKWNVWDISKKMGVQLQLTNLVWILKYWEFNFFQLFVKLFLLFR